MIDNKQKKRNFLKVTITFLLSILFLNQSYSQIVQTISSNTTFNVPQGVIEITVECWGAGGGGGNSGSDRPGGGGGAYARSVVSVSTGQSYTITIGSGGGEGTNGGNTSFGSNVIAAGGSSSASGTGGVGGQASASTGTFRFSGGNGANAPGGGGSSAGTNANGNNASGQNGGIAPTGGGNGGSIPIGNNESGTQGASPGGGGGGRTGPGNGGSVASGANGLVRITYFQTLPTDHFRTITTGTWSDRTTWESSSNGTNWIPAQAKPTNQASSILIQNSHTVSLNGNETGKNITINGTLNLSTFNLTGSSNFILNSGSLLQVRGASNFPTGFTLSINTGSTVEYNRADNQSIFSTNYHHLILTGSGTKSFTTSTTTIGGNLLFDGVTSSLVTGLTIGGNVTFERAFNVTLGTFTHNVAGNWTKNGWGSYNSSGSTINFTGNTSQINGSHSTQNFNNIIVSKNSGQNLNVISSAELTISGNFTLASGNYNQGTTNSVISGNWINNGGTLDSSAGIIRMNGSGATIGGSTSTIFNNLTINNNSSGISLNRNITINGTLNLSNGLLSLGNFNLTLGPSANSVQGSFWTGNMIIINGSGELRKVFSNPGTYFFPIGEVTGTTEYTPATITVNSGSFSAGSYIGLRVIDDKHPQNNNTSNHITRYWSVSQSGITSLNYNFLAPFNWGGDMVGQESLQNSVLYTGSLPWIVFSQLASSQVSANGVTQTGDFTAFGIPVINNSESTLSGFTYLVGNGPSATQNFLLSGNNLEGNVILTAPTDYEISINWDTGFQSSLSFTPTNGAIGWPTIYVRLKAGLNIGTYNNQILEITSIGATTKQIVLNGNVTGPTITTGTISGSPINVCSNINVPFTITGIFNSGNIFTAQLSDANGSFASPQNIGSITQTTAGTINATIPSGTPSGSAYRIRVVSSNPTITGSINNTDIELINQINSPGVTNANICIGGPTTAHILTASGAVSGQRYRWYSAASGGSILKTSTDNNDNTYTTPSLNTTTHYWVSIVNASNCESARIQISALNPALSTEDQTTEGNNSWIGHVYDGTNQSVTFDGNFTNYYGSYTENELFDQNFGGDINCFPFTSGTENRTILTTTFSVRYRMKTTRSGMYVVDLGSDDGTRLTIDGNLFYNNWSNQAFSTRPRVLISLNGDNSLVYDFYENTGGNRTIFNNLSLIIENKLTTNTYQEICIGTTSAQTINGDVYPGTLPAGITLTGTGYQWTYSTSLGGPRTNISGATAASFTPNTSVAPFNNPGTYYVYRNTTLQSSNNIGMPNPFLISNESEPAILVISDNLPTVATSSPGSRCGPGNLTISATASSGVINWFANPTGGTAISTGTDFSTTINSSTTYYAEANNGCKSASRTAVTAHIITPPSVSATGTGTYCTTNTINLGSTSTSGSTLFWTGPNSFYSTNANPVLNNATTSMAGTYTVVASALSNINLVSNGGFESGNTGFLSNYVYVAPVANALHPEGVYTITANPNSVHNDFSTCSPRGSLQMIINGAGAANVSIWEQTVNVMPNTDYQFTYYVQSVHPTSPSVLQLYVNDVAAGPTKTASSTTCVWDQFLYNWNSGSNTTAKLSLVNQNTAPNGNDFALDDIFFQHVCTDSSIAVVQIVSSGTPAINIVSSETSCCQGSQIDFIASSSFGGLSPTYQWRVNGVNQGTNSTLFSYTPANNDVVSCVLTSSLTCRTADFATSNSINLTTYTAVTATPTLNSPIYIASTTVSGQSEPNAFIYVYSSSTSAGPSAPSNPNPSNNQGNSRASTLIGSTTADGSGNWTATVSSIQPLTQIHTQAKLPLQCLSNSSNLVQPTWDPLPVELILFTAKALENKVELRWATATEINNDFFLIYRSINGKDWSVIARVEGNGNSNQIINYLYYDNFHFHGNVYYKLIQYDFDGSNEESHIITVDLSSSVKNQIKTKIFPNPKSSNDELFIVYESNFKQEIQISIYNLTGVLVFAKKVETQEDGYLLYNLRLLEGLKPGHYFINIKSEQFNKTEKLIIIN